MHLTSFSHVLLRLIASCYENSSAPDYNDNYPERFSGRVNDRLRVYNKFAGNEFEVSVSIGGICKHITDIHELEDMFTQADKIMYASKLERHKNRK